MVYMVVGICWFLMPFKSFLKNYLHFSCVCGEKTYALQSSKRHPSGTINRYTKINKKKLRIMKDISSIFFFFLPTHPYNTITT